MKVLVKAKGRAAGPTLSPDGTIVALHEESGGIFFISCRHSQSDAVKKVVASEYPIRFVDGGRSLLVADESSKEIILTLVDLASGRRMPWNDCPSVFSAKEKQSW